MDVRHRCSGGSIAPDQAGDFCGRSRGQKLVWKACKSPWCDKFPRGSYEMQSWRRKHILTARQRLDESLLGEGHTDHTRTVGLVHELLVLARQAHKPATFPVSLILCGRRQSFWKLRLRTIATLLAWMIRTWKWERLAWPTRPYACSSRRRADHGHDSRCSEGAPAHTGTNRIPSSARQCG